MRILAIALLILLGPSFPLTLLAEVLDFHNVQTVSFSESKKVQVLIKNSIYTIDGSAAGDLSQLSATEKASFLQTRIDYLTQTAKSLQALKWGFGIGALVKNHLEFRSEKKVLKQLLEESKNLDPSAREDLLMAAQKLESISNQKKSDQKNKTFSIKSDEVLLQILTMLDQQLWKQTQIVAHANEFGAIAAIGIEAEGGSRSGSGWGALTDIGISIGYNRDEKSVAIQIFHGWEPFKSTEMPLFFIAGLVGKLGVYAANQGKDLTAKGASYYPPMAPLFATATNRSFMAGVSSGLTWPPSPLGDMLTYSNSVSQTTLLRLTVSRLTKGFVRIQSGILNQIGNVNYSSVKNIILHLKNNNEPNQCHKLFI